MNAPQASPNTCVTLIVRDDEIAKYFTKEMQKAANASTSHGCAICGNSNAKEFLIICDQFKHRACGPCTKVKSKVCKIVSTRGGPKKCCGAEDCKAGFFAPVLDPAYTKVVHDSVAMVDETLRDYKNSKERGSDGLDRRRDAVEAVRNKRGNSRTKAEVIAEDGEEAWNEISEARKLRKKTKEYNAKLFEHAVPELTKIMGKAKYDAWHRVIFGCSPPPAEVTAVDNEIDGDFGMEN